MRLVRIIALLAVAAVVALGGLAAFIVYHQQELLRLLLDRINQGTGLVITPDRATLELRGRLVLVLERPRVQRDNQTIASLKELRAVISYRSLVYSKGLPLSALVLVSPTFYCEPISCAPASLAAPKGREFARHVTDLARRLTLVTRRLEITDGTFVGPDNTPLAEKFSLSAFRRHYPWAPWQISFDGIWREGKLSGMRAAATFSASLTSYDAGRTVSSGTLWFWALPLQALTYSDFEPAGELQGEIHFGLGEDGELAGSANLRAKALAIRGPLVRRPLVLGENTAGASFRLENGRAVFTRLVARHNNSRLLAGELTVQDLYSWDTGVSGHISGLRLDVLQTRLFLKQVRGLDNQLLNALDRISSGSAIVEDAAFKLGKLADFRSYPAFLKGLSLAIRLDDLGIAAPPGSSAPAIRRVNGRLTYGGWVVNVNQLGAAVGRSTIDELSVNARISHDLKTVSYSARAKGEAQLDELFPIVNPELSKRLSGPPLMRINALNGEADFQVEAAGVMREWEAAMPTDYTILLAPRRGDLTLDKVPDKIALRGGTLTVTPRVVELDKFTVTPATGTLILSGELSVEAAGVSLHRMEAELHGVSVDRWLPLWVEPQALSVSGQAGGQVALSAVSPGRWAATGILTMGQGEFQFGFLRSPITVRSASLLLDGRGMRLAMPASFLEGAPLDFELSVADLTQPVLRIDAVAQRMDLEVMKFVRLPWSPKTPTTFFRTKVVGHLETPQAKFDKLAMTDLAADFERDKVEWHVRNLKAHAFAGETAAEFSGRAKDDWIHIKGHVDGMDAKPLFLLPRTGEGPPILDGQLSAQMDLWGDTGEQFFNTLAGQLSIRLSDGTLRKFTMLSRMLALIDLKSWLTARVPDPRVSGVPFKSLTGDFAGKDGDFFSDNIRLDGPVMEISAQGELNLGTATTDMQVAILPFQTVRWLTEEIPFFGENLAGASSSLLGAYFQVRGPIANPSVTPKPITSATQIIKKMLGLPLNIIRPNTVR